MEKFGIYVHWPFCAKKCPYCDFNSYEIYMITEKEWKKSILKEIQNYKELYQEKKLKSIFFGGGTPSLMNDETIFEIIDEIKKTFKNHNKNLEITIEANPSSVEISKFEKISKTGTNRISIGIQSFNDSNLKFLGRNHTKNEAINALLISKKYFTNVSFDLIYTLPEQTKKQWAKELSMGLKFDPNHLSMYQLIIEKNTKFFNLYSKNEKIMPSSNHSHEMYLYTNRKMGSLGYDNYEISNYAKNNKYKSVHNLLYWEYEDFLGLGPGAHGRITINGKKHSTFNTKNPKTWHMEIQTENRHDGFIKTIDEKQMLNEYVLMKSRIKKPILLSAKINNKKIIDSISMEKANNLKKAGFLNIDDTKISFTNKGRLCINSVIVELF